MFFNNGLLELKRGTHPQQPEHPGHLAIALDVTFKALNSHSVRTGFYSRWQFRLLIAGAILFIAWRVIGIVRASGQ